MSTHPAASTATSRSDAPIRPVSPGAIYDRGVKLTLQPEPPPAVAKAVELAVAEAITHGSSGAYASRWRRAALAEATAAVPARGAAERERLGALTAQNAWRDPCVVET